MQDYYKAKFTWDYDDKRMRYDVTEWDNPVNGVRLGKDEVAGSIPVGGSITFHTPNLTTSSPPKPWPKRRFLPAPGT